jgi:hypothetical protein
MSIATADSFENHATIRASRRTNRLAIFTGIALAAAALAPFAVAAFGIARGGIEPYMVLAALVLG